MWKPPVLRPTQFRSSLLSSNLLLEFSIPPNHLKNLFTKAIYCLPLFYNLVTSGHRDRNGQQSSKWNLLCGTKWIFSPGHIIFVNNVIKIIPFVLNWKSSKIKTKIYGRKVFLPFISIPSHLIRDFVLSPRRQKVPVWRLGTISF